MSDNNVICQQCGASTRLHTPAGWGQTERPVCTMDISHKISSPVTMDVLRLAHNAAITAKNTVKQSEAMERLANLMARATPEVLREYSAQSTTIKDAKVVVAA